MKYALLVFWAAGTLAAPFLVLDDRLPRTEVKDLGCKSSRFQNGQTFVYDYAGETLNNIEGSSKHSTGLKLRARVSIIPLSECKFTMMVSQAELLSKSKTDNSFMRTAESAKFKKEIEQFQLGFTMSGKRMIFLQPHKFEKTHIMNIKRGMLSTLQVDEQASMEQDVNGLCETEIKMENGKVVKTKNLAKCSNRAQNEIGIQSATIKTGSPLKPLDSNSKCTYTLDGTTIKKVVCDETHLFRPFSAGYKTPAGAMTTVKQTIEFVKFKPTPVNVGLGEEVLGEETTLTFDHSAEEMSASNKITGHVDQIMNNLVKTMSAQQSSAHEFTSLVFVLRKMDEKRIKPVWDKYFDCIESKTCENKPELRDVYRQYLLDAIAYCGTSTCISMVRNVIIDGAVSGERMNMFLQSIALVGKTTKKMIHNVLEIVKKQPSRQAYLTLGTLISRHCSKNPEECEFGNSNPISQAESFLEKKLGLGCSGQENHERVEEIIMALKAIGNARRPIRVRSNLIRCAKNAQHANITRAAFDAFRGMPCDTAHSDDIMHVLNNDVVDPEIRIHAFLALMNCPSEDVLDHILHSLEKEQCKQVASFIWSHLSNIMESSDPRHKTTKVLLEHLTKERSLRVVDLPFHKFSRSYEKSIHIESMKTGATVEGHMIFHPKGYFPKSGLFNLTADVMGVPVHLVEAVVGIDGLESLLANAFGPNGVMPNNNFILNIFNYTYTAEKFREMAQKAEESNVRQRRGADDKLSEIHQRVNMKSTVPTGHFSVKVMGQEVRVMSYDDIAYMIDQIDNMNVVQLMMNVAKGGHKTFSKSMMFLELTHTVPTSVGLPLRLKLVGSTVATVELKGKFDIRNMFWGPGALTIDGSVTPSTVVELSGQMGIDSHFIQSGVFVNSSMFVSNVLKGSIKYKEGQLLKINVDTPEEPLAQVNFSSTPFMYMNEQQDLIEGAPRKINPDFCLKSKILGYGLCANLRLPVAFREYDYPYYPLSGPAHFGLKLVRGDEKLTTYQFLMEMTKKDSTTAGKMEFSTPGAAYERKLNGEMTFSDIDNTKTLVLSTERYGKEAAIEFSYNSITNRAAVETRNNLFTPKPVVMRMVYFNQTNMVSKQFGLLVATEYDWYKFEHVTKFVQKETGYMLHASTTYYPKKTMTGVLEYNTRDKKVTARFDSDQLKQAAEISGQWTVKGAMKSLTLTAAHLSSGKSASLTTGFVNEENKKELIISATALGKTLSNTLGYYAESKVYTISNVFNYNGKIASWSTVYNNQKLEFDVNVFGRKAGSEMLLKNTEAEKSMEWSVYADKSKTLAMTKVGYYKETTLKSLKINMEAFGKEGEVFVNLHSAEGYRTTFGARYGKYIAGIRGVYTNNHGHGKSGCASAYYGTETNEKEPMLWCVKYHTLGSKYVHNRLVFSVEMKGMDKKAEIEFDYEKHTGHIKLEGKAKYNSKVYGKNSYELKYADMKDASLKMDVEIGTTTTGWKLFTEKAGDDQNYGVQAYYNDKIVLFLNKYTKYTAGSTTEMQLKSQLIINGKPLPVSTEFNFISGEGNKGPLIRVFIGEYAFTYATMVTYIKMEYGLGSEFIATKGEKILFKTFQQSTLTLRDGKQLSQKLGFVIFDKTYEYGWEAVYENRGTASKTAHALTFRLQYATNKKSAITFTFANGKKTAEVIVDVEYVPTKTVSHFVRYTKASRQLDVSLEFLPKMFTTFMARLDKSNGYSLNTKWNVAWAGYKRSLKILNSYTTTRKGMTLSTNIGKDISFGVTYTKKPQKSVKIFGNVFKHDGKIVAIISGKIAQLRFILNRKLLMNIAGSYSKPKRAFTLTAGNARKTWVKVAGDYNRFIRKVTLTVSGKREWFNINGRYGRRSNEVVLGAGFLNKQYLKVKAQKKGNSVSLKLTAVQMKRDITFTGSLKKQEKSVTVAAETGGNRVGLKMRADWINMITGVSAFYNKMESGWKLFSQKHAIVYQLMFTKQSSAQMIFEVQDDRIVKMTVQRTSNNKDTNETSFQFTLGNGLSHFMFKWNPETISKITTSIVDLIKPLVQKIMSESKKFSKNALKISKKFLHESMMDTRTAVINFLNKVDKSFDEIDFVGLKDKFGEVTLRTLRKMAQLIRRSLRAAAKGLDNIKENIPEWIHQTKELATSAKNMMKNLKLDLVKNMKSINAIVTKVAKNLTESARPVINKAVELLNEFKIRGKTMKEISALAVEMGKKYTKLYTKEFYAKVELIKVKLEVLKVKATKLYNDAKVQILKTKIPYRDETVEQVIKIVLEKVEELKQKVLAIDVMKHLEKSHATIMDYKVQGKPVKQHLALLKKDLKNLPETTRKAILELIRLVRVYSKEIKVTCEKVAKFAEPATKHIMFVLETIEKHFQPLYIKPVRKIIWTLYHLELPSIRPALMKQWKKIEESYLQLLKPIKPLYNSLKRQIRQLRINGYRVGPLFDMKMQEMGDTIEDFVKESMKMIDDQMWTVRNFVEDTLSMTPEEIVNQVFDSSMEMTNEAVAYLKKMYKKRAQLMKKATRKVKQVYNKVSKEYKKISNKPSEELMETFIHSSSEQLMFYAEELSSLLKQLANMDIAGPTWRAWKDADILGHLDRYGVNGKIMNTIQAAKDIKLVKLLETTIQNMQKLISQLYSQAFVKAIKTYGKMENVVDYIRSIPKKEYEQWFNELKDFTMTHKQWAGKMMVETYKMSEEHVKTLYATMKTISIKNYKEISTKVMKKYVEPAQDLYKDVVRRSVLVYDEVKQPTIDVTNHYKVIVTKFAKENYEIVQARLMKEYKKVYAQLQTKMMELRQQMEDKYEEFLNKYGDMTWEEVGQEVYKYGDEQTKVAKKMVMTNYKKYAALTLKYKAQVERLYAKYSAKVKAYYQKYKQMAEDKYTEMKPKVLAKYNEYKTLAEKEYTKTLKKANKMYSDMKEKATSVYNNNKDKPLKKIYIEIKTMIVDQFNKQNAIVVAFINKKTTEMKVLAKKYYTKADVLMRSIILPELMKESESLINQTLHCSVVMANETTKAFYPHFMLVKNTLSKFVTEMQSEAVIAFGKSKATIKKNVDKLIALLKEMLVKIQNHELYNKAINHEYVLKVSKIIKDLIKTSQKKIEELKSHPTTLKYRKQINEKVAEYRQKIAEYKTELENMYKKYSQHSKVVQVLKVLKQIRKSCLFTYNQLRMKVIPQIEFMIKLAHPVTPKNIQTKIETAFVFFRQQPEDAFWMAVAEIKTSAMKCYSHVMTMNLKMIKKQAKFYLDLGKDVGTMLVNECFDEWTTETANALYNDAIKTAKNTKRFIRSLPGKAKTIVIKTYEENMKKINKWSKQQIKMLNNQWEKSEVKHFVNNPIWKELADEVVTHELVELIQTVAGMAKDKLMDLKSLALKEIRKQREFLEMKYEEWRVKAVHHYKKMKKTVTTKYDEAVQKYNEMIKKAEEFVETVTIADIVQYTQQKYIEAVEKVKETKMKLMKLKNEYIVKAKTLYVKYKKEAEQMYKELYAKGKVLVQKYKKMVMPHYNKAKKVLDKYQPIAMAKYQELKQKIEKLIKKLDEKRKELQLKIVFKYMQLKLKAESMYNEHKAKAITMVKKARTDAYKQWMESDVRAKLISLKKMSIRETIEALKKLPKETKALVIKTYNKYYKLAEEKIRTEYSLLLAKYEAKKSELMRLAEPYIKPTLIAYKWVENELVETAVFIYKYHHLAERYENAKSFIISEYKRIVPLIPATLNKYAIQSKLLAIKYAKKYSVVAKKYAAISKDYAEKMASKAGHGVLRSIHCTFRYIDSIDMKSIKTRTQSYIQFVKKYISIDTKNGEFIISVPVGLETPSFTFQINKASRRVRKSVQEIREQSNTALRKIKSQLDDLKVKAQKIKAKLVQQALENTKELRKDLQISYAVNKKVAEHVYAKATIFAQKTYKNAVAVYRAYKPKALKLVQKAKAMSKKYYKKFLERSRDAYLKASQFILKLYKAGPTNSFYIIKSMSVKYYKLAKQQTMNMYRKYKPIVKANAKKYMKIMKVKALKVKREVQPYYNAVEKAVLDVKKGVAVKTAFYPIYRSVVFVTKFYKQKLNNKMETLRNKACKSDPKLCFLAKQSLRVHTDLYNKYNTRATDYYDTMRAHLHKGLRTFTSFMKTKGCITGKDYFDVAMIFGNERVLTFDKKFYDLPKNKNPACSYLLAHDFADDTFVIKKEHNAIVVETEDMSIKIKANGKTKTTKGKQVINTLPVESKSAKCFRKNQLIICHFADQKIRVVVDLEHFLTKISMSGWHYGRSLGLLGTNNRESYDDWKLPSGKITNNIFKFLNQYELSGKAQCQLKEQKFVKPKCPKVPSSKCKELFESKDSKYVAFFKSIKPEAFLRACEMETSDCKKNANHCGSAAAFVMMARSKGHWISHLPECMSMNTHSVGDEWVQKPLKRAVDIVFMMSQRKNVFSSRKQVGHMMKHLHKALKSVRYNVRYSLVGFGGNGIHEQAHVVPLGTGADVFGSLPDLQTAIKTLPYKGVGTTSNDAYHAVLTASKLSFRAGASKIFILFNTEPHSSHEQGPAYEEALYMLKKEANAALYVFDKFNFKHIAGAGHVIGETPRKMYTVKHIKGLPRGNSDAPPSEFATMSKATNGGWFSSRVKNSKQVASSLYHAISSQLRIDSTMCKVCQLKATYTGQPRAACQSDEKAKC